MVRHYIRAKRLKVLKTFVASSAALKCIRQTVWLAFLVTLFPIQSTAATITLEGPGKAILEGPITPGDAERLIEAQRSQLHREGKPLRLLFLSSNGGSLAEAVRLATIIELFRLDVMVPSGSQCASSCFLLYVAGSTRVAMAELDSALGGRLGIHRPFNNRIDIQDGELPRAEAEQRALMSRMQVFLRERNVPQDLIEKLLQYSSQEIYWLSDADLVSLGGFSPNYEELIIRKCGRSPDIARQILNPIGSRDTEEIVQTMDALNSCQVRVMAALRSKEVRAALARMGRGWRPWQSTR